MKTNFGDAMDVIVPVNGETHPGAMLLRSEEGRTWVRTADAANALRTVVALSG